MPMVEIVFMKISDFEKFGLERKEAKVYLAILEIGSGTALDVAKKVAIPKSTAHDILQGLVTKGLASTFRKKNKKYYTASDPEQLAERPKEQLQVFERLLPELQALAYSGVGKPRVRYFDTKVGIQVAMKEMLDEAKNLITYGNVDAVFTTYPEYFPDYTQKRIKKGIITRAILFEGPIAGELQEKDVQSIRKIKIIKPAADSSSLYWIWNDKFVIFNTIGDHSVLIVEDKRFVSLIKSMFETLWNS